jgi:integrase
MHVLTPIALDELLRAFLVQVDSKDIYYKALFQCLYNTGLRFNEARMINEWVDSGNESYFIQTEKGGNIREVKKTDIPGIVQNLISKNDLTFLRLCNSTACYYMGLYLPHQKIFSGTNEIKTHLFRHNKVKQMALAGSSREQIAIYLGEKDLKNISHYDNSQLWYL